MFSNATSVFALSIRLALSSHVYFLICAPSLQLLMNDLIERSALLQYALANASQLGLQITDATTQRGIGHDSDEKLSELNDEAEQQPLIQRQSSMAIMSSLLVGTVDRRMQAMFSRMLFRTTRGNAIIRFAELPPLPPSDALDEVRRYLPQSDRTLFVCRYFGLYCLLCRDFCLSFVALASMQAYNRWLEFAKQPLCTVRHYMIWIELHPALDLRWNSVCSK